MIVLWLDDDESDRIHSHCIKVSNLPTLVNTLSTVICKVDSRGHRRDSFDYYLVSATVKALLIQAHTFTCSYVHLLDFSSWHPPIISLSVCILYCLNEQRSASGSMESCEYFYKGQVMLCLFIFRCTQSKMYIYIFILYIRLFILSFHVWLSFIVTMLISSFFFLSFLMFICFLCKKASGPLFSVHAALEERRAVPNASLYTPHTCVRSLPDVGRAHLFFKKKKKNMERP